MTTHGPHSMGRRGFLGAAALAAGTTFTGLRPAHGAPTRSTTASDTSQELARTLLLVGENGEDLKLAYLRILINDGLPKQGRPKKIAVVGAGIAGLVAADLLRAAGHQVTIIEANANRTGGRIKTFRGVFEDKSLHAEAGAMRLPDFHPMVLALVDKLGLRRRLFYNADVAPGAQPVGPVPPVVYRAFTGESWTNGTPVDFQAPQPTLRSLIQVNGMRVTRGQYAARPTEINRSFGAALTGTTAAAVDRALAPVTVPQSVSIEERITAWARLIQDFDDYSTHRYLVEQAGWGLADIEAAGTLENMTSRLHYSLFPTLMDHAIISPTNRYWELENGTAALTDALTAKLDTVIRRNRRMTALTQTDKGVRIETTAESGTEDGCHGGPVRPVETFEADYAVITVPLTALRFCEFTPLLSYPKRRAIAALHYDSATKVLLEFRTRFWERGPDGFTGGGCVTDSPNRFTYFPSHVPHSRGGVVLASYTWSDEAMRWDSLTDDERYAFALDNMARLFGRQVYDEFTGHGATQSWTRNRYALGEAAIFTPGQLHEYHAATRTTEGRLHFAGEHTSLKPAWIEGSLESAVRAALEVNQR
ncbi:flavin monoamine oxidase family protein [Goodfellowiella coeruleoviolacea]|uniref:Monoamine oxidase n=1 Tax=Goodfellowiella coeruleoviolacea TaxID=334858 RepID=A0AAE3GJH2_9PSEU|nr:FAD-dependent oxidoreductase [Goodfellowiella coeruleoviolacea]MCP2168552.1 monoamine oxidase [Goodfellowiella coeruleoviolacea]